MKQKSTRLARTHSRFMCSTNYGYGYAKAYSSMRANIILQDTNAADLRCHEALPRLGAARYVVRLNESVGAPKLDERQR